MDRIALGVLSGRMNQIKGELIELRKDIEALIKEAAAKHSDDLESLDDMATFLNELTVKTMDIDSLILSIQDRATRAASRFEVIAENLRMLFEDASR